MDYEKGFVRSNSHEILVDVDGSRLSSAILISVLGSGYIVRLYGTLYIERGTSTFVDVDTRLSCLLSHIHQLD